MKSKQISIISTDDDKFKNIKCNLGEFAKYFEQSDIIVKKEGSKFRVLKNRYGKEKIISQLDLINYIFT